MSRVTRWSCVAALSIGATVWLAQGCSRDSVVTPDTPPRFLKPAQEADAPTAPRLLLFIHGIFGDTVGTWSYDGNSNLPSIIVERPEFANGFDAFAFGFPSDMVNAGSFRIPEAAKTFATEINYRGFLQKYREIVIVAHSMGGLVAIEALTTFPALRAKVPLLVAFATPYDGAQVTKLARQVLRNPAIEDRLPLVGGNTFLSSLSNRWREVKNDIGARTRVLCAYETVPFPGVGLIVPEPSGTSLCDGTADPIAEDHIGIIKPRTAEHQSVKVLANALRSLPPLCDLTIVEPTAGARVGNAVTVRGTANGLKAGQHLWVLVNPEGMQARWPQGNAPATIRDGTWTVQAYVGQADRPIDEVAFLQAIIVDSATNQMLQRANGAKLDSLPDIVDECPVRDVKVTKVSK